MVREGVLMIRETAIGMGVTAATFANANCCAGNFQNGVQRGKQVKADIPDKHQREQK